MLGQVLGALVELDVVGQQARPFDAHALDVARQLLAPRSQLRHLCLQACRGRFFGAGPFLQARQLRAQRRVLLPDRVHLRLQTFELAARDLDRLFLIEAGLFFFGHQRMVALALVTGALVFASEPVQLQARRRKA